MDTDLDRLESVQGCLNNDGRHKLALIVQNAREEIVALREDKARLNWMLANVGKHYGSLCDTREAIDAMITKMKQAFRAEVIVNGHCVAVRWGYPDTYADLVERAFAEAKYPYDPKWKLTDYAGYRMDPAERLEPTETRTQKPLYLSPPAGVGA